MSVVPNLLVLVRHGQSARNAAKTGHVFFPDDAARAPFVGTADQDAALTDKGWAEARAVGVGLKERFGTFDVIFHSGYRRTRDTTSAILEAWPDDERAAIEVREHMLLRERDTGYTANMTAAEVPSVFPWLQEYWDATGPFISRPPGGESMADVAQRVQLFLNSHTEALATKRVLIVTHLGTLRMFRFTLEHWTQDETVKSIAAGGFKNGHVTAYQADSFTGRLKPLE